MKTVDYSSYLWPLGESSNSVLVLKPNTWYDVSDLSEEAGVTLACPTTKKTGKKGEAFMAYFSASGGTDYVYFYDTDDNYIGWAPTPDYIDDNPDNYVSFVQYACVNGQIMRMFEN